MRVRALILAVNDKSLLDLHVDVSRHLWSQHTWSVLIQPFLTEDIQDHGVVLIL